jgi:sigma-B regulation protein RsbU (phosphoserine phosphatase)
VKDNYEIAGECRSAGYVGGDTFDFFIRKDGKIAAFILDVSGHSINTSVLMATVRGYLKSLLHNSYDIVDAVTSANQLICDDIGDAGLFVTGLVMIIDTVENVLEFINMGHYPFMAIDKNLNFFENNIASMPLGILKDEVYEAAKIEINAGTTIFTYTDGLLESKSQKGQLFGYEHIQNFFKKQKYESPENIIKMFFREYKKHVGSKPQEDDITLMAIKRAL